MSVNIPGLNGEIHVTISLGAVNYTHDVKDPFEVDEKGKPQWKKKDLDIMAEMYNGADKALYRSKQDGRNRLTVVGID